MAYHRFHQIQENSEQNLNISMSKKDTMDLRHNYKLFLKRHKQPQWEFKLKKWTRDTDIYKGEFPKE